MQPEEICSHYSNWIVARRWAATWLDLLLFIWVIIALVSNTGTNHLAGAVLVWFVLTALYYPVLEGYTGSTLGKWICGLKVVDEHGNRPGFVKALVRTLFRLLEINPLLFGGLPAGIAVITSKKKQRIGDMVASTYVLRTEDLPYLTMSPPTPTYTPSPFPAFTPPYSSPMPMPPQNRSGYDMIPPTLPYGAPNPSSSPYGTPEPPAPPYGAPTHPSLPYGATTPLLPYPEVSALDFQPAAVPWSIKKRILLMSGIIGLLGIGSLRNGYLDANKEYNDRHPTTMSITKFLKAPPDEGWYHLTNCHIDLTDALIYKDTDDSGLSSVRDSNNRIADIYIPVYASDNTEDSAKTPLLVYSTDPVILERVKEIRKVNADGDAALRKWIKAHYNEVVIQKDITGTIQSHIFQSTATHEDLLQLDPEHLTPQFVIIHEGDTPMVVGPVAIFFLGFMNIALGISIGIYGLACPARE